MEKPEKSLKLLILERVTGAKAKNANTCKVYKTSRNVQAIKQRDGIMQISMKMKSIKYS